MKDRELLELASKAAGLTIIYHSQEARDAAGHGSAGLYVRWSGGGISTCWNPLTDDGDALRLVVKLRLSVDHNHSADQQRWVSADRNGCEGCYSPVSCVEDEFDERDRSAATRRAIVRAAAEIGRLMP